MTRRDPPGSTGRVLRLGEVEVARVRRLDRACAAFGQAGRTVLGPLAARYLGPRMEIPPELDGVVRAMPIVLRLERPPAGRTSVLEAAARAALAVCLDPRAEPGGEWHDAVVTWVAARIRKIARRARGAHWSAVQELPGVTVDVDGAQARALLPGPVDDVPKVVSRLQIGGTDLPDDDPGAARPGVPVIWVNGALGMTVGKAAAQVGHASMLDAAARGLCDVPAYAVRTAAGTMGAAVPWPSTAGGRRGTRRGVHRGGAGHDHSDHHAGLICLARRKGGAGRWVGPGAVLLRASTSGSRRLPAARARGRARVRGTGAGSARREVRERREPSGDRRARSARQSARSPRGCPARTLR